MVAYSLPADAIAYVPVIYRDDNSVSLDPVAGWAVVSGDPQVVAVEFSDDRREVKLIPAGAPGAMAQVVIERDGPLPVRDTLEVTIGAARITRVAFDIANARLEPLHPHLDPAQTAALSAGATDSGVGDYSSGAVHWGGVAGNPVPLVYGATRVSDSGYHELHGGETVLPTHISSGGDTVSGAV